MYIHSLEETLQLIDGCTLVLQSSIRVKDFFPFARPPDQTRYLAHMDSILIQVQRRRIVYLPKVAFDASHTTFLPPGMERLTYCTSYYTTVLVYCTTILLYLDIDIL